MKLFLTVLILSLLSACSTILDPWVYKMAIQQGNVVEKEQYESLELGMTKEQVAFVLGTPVIQDTFNADRWDYVYRLKRRWGKPEQDNLYVLFKDNKLVQIGGSYKQQFEAMDDEKSTTKAQEQ